ncbi:MAG: hypothetical protein NT080_10915 [Spirochaetes bacterium]|nr:hypothetical protein [Spirochaetota bacterium]
MDVVIAWLMDGDPAIRFQAARDLLGESGPALERRRTLIAREGWGRTLLDARGSDGLWCGDFYVPKWKCTHYVLAELRGLDLDPADEACRESVGLVLDAPSGRDGGINYAKTVEVSDVCVNGMILDFSSWFRAPGRPGSTGKSPALRGGGTRCARSAS